MAGIFLNARGVVQWRDLPLGFGGRVLGVGIAGNTAAAVVGTPPMAILYANVDTRRAAATQNAFYGFDTLVAIFTLWIAGVISLSQPPFAASLAPFVPIAVGAPLPFTKSYERGAILPWALGMAPMSGLILLAWSI